MPASICGILILFVFVCAFEPIDLFFQPIGFLIWIYISLEPPDYDLTTMYSAEDYWYIPAWFCSVKS